MPCIAKLLEAFEKEQKEGTLNEEKTLAYYNTLLEQLKREKGNEIKNTLKLLSSANVVKPAKTLYYFKEENAKCTLHEKYLKRVCGMSHTDTLELAKLCGVNVLPYHIDASFIKKKRMKTLKDFYLERLPFIVLKESRERNENPSMIVKNLYKKICSIELFECQEIRIKYPFGNPVKERSYFDGLKIYVLADWINHSSCIHKYIKEKLSLKADLDDIIDIQNISQEKKDMWIEYENQNSEVFYKIEKEMQSLLSTQENKSTDANQPIQYNFGKDSARDSLPKLYSARNKDQKELLGQKNENIDDEIASYLKLNKEAVKPVIPKSHNESLYEAVSDRAQKDSSKEASGSECPDYKFKEAKFKEAILNVLSPYFITEQGICRNYAFKKSLEQESKRNIEGELLCSKENKVESPLVSACTIQRQSVCDNNSLTQSQRKELKGNLHQEPELEIWNDLKEFYLKRLSIISIRESRNVEMTPFVILKRLYDKVISIKLIYYNPNKEEVACDKSVGTKCYFDGLKVYVPGKWTNYETDIHQHIIQELCINSNIDDILDMKTVTEASKEEWVRGNEESLITFLLIEEALRRLLQDRTKLNQQETGAFQKAKDNDKNTEKPDKFAESCKKKSSKKSDCRTPAINQTFSTRGARFQTDKSHLQRFNEHYVFTFLLEHYKRKYPNARCSLMTKDYVLLEWESHRIVIIWINESGDQEGSFDIMVKKDHKIALSIEVQSVNVKNELFNVNHRIFLKAKGMIGFFEDSMLYRKTFRIYCVVNSQMSTPTDGSISEPLAVYKIAPVKLPKI